MRRTALGVAGAAIIASGTVALVARGSVRPATSPDPVTLKIVDQHSATPSADPNDVLRYWGAIKNHNQTTTLGSYRATCLALGGPTEDRLTCNVVLAFDTHASTMIAQGLVKRPQSGHGLLEGIPGQSTRKLVITGGTGDYEQMQGSADLQGTGTVVLTLQQTFTEAS